MKIEELVGTIERQVPMPEELEFDRIGVIRSTNKDITKIGICVDLTDHVMDEAIKQGIGFLIVHHGHGETVRERVDQLGDSIGAYGIHLALDTMQQGLVDNLAGILSLKDRFDITFDYKGHTVKKGAVLGNRLYCTSDRVHDVARVLMRYLSKDLSRVEIKAYNTNPRADADAIIVAPGPAIRKEFLEQAADVLRAYENPLFVAGSIKNGAEETAKQLGIQLLTIGDFESHYPGMKAFARALNKKLSNPDYCSVAGSQNATQDGCAPEVVFLPNYDLRK